MRTTAARAGMFRSLRVRNYRLFATGQIVSNTGTWMQRIAQDWLVLSITDSPTAVGITTAAQFLPMLLFGLFGGIVADRYPKRRILLITQAAMGVQAAVLAALTLTGLVQVWCVWLCALWLGMATVIDNPTRQTFAMEMVGADDLRNAVSLNAAIFQSARLVGPAVAGLLIAAVGAGWAFGLNAASYLAVLCGLALMRESELQPTARVPRARGQLRAGLRHIGSNPRLVWPIVLVAFIGTFGYNWAIVLSAFAKDVFQQGAETYGVLNTIMAVGSLIGALLAARRTNARLRLLVGAAIGFGALEMLAALVPWFWVFCPVLLITGLVGMTFNNTANTTVQLNSDPQLRGRVMGVYVLVFTGGTPLGGPLVGWVTERFGARAGLFFCGAVAALAAAAVAVVLLRAGHGRRPAATRAVTALTGRRA